MNPLRPFGIAAQALRIASQRRLQEGLARYPQTHPSTDVVVFEPYAAISTSSTCRS